MNTTLEPQNIKTPRCFPKEPPVDKTTKSKVVKLVRRIKQTIKPTHCKIRWDSMVQKWAVLNEKLELVRHFEYGYMTNVRFTPMKATIPSICVYNENIGIAEGDLIEGDHGSDALGFVNIGFNGNQFVDAQGQAIVAAQTLRLMGGRSALVKL